MCCSLYDKPSEKLLELFNYLEISMLKAVSTIKTVSLKYFTANNKVGPVDFIKIDIQGAELDVFQGGITTQRDVVAIVGQLAGDRTRKDSPMPTSISSLVSTSTLNEWPDEKSLS